MPTYEYECDACGHAFEQFQRMTDPAVRKCPKCRKLKVRRLISGGAGVIFKGSGFYETDYKRNRSGGPRKESGGEGDSKPPETKPSDSKPADAKPSGDSARKDTGAKPAAKPASGAKKDA